MTVSFFNKFVNFFKRLFGIGDYVIENFEEKQIEPVEILSFYPEIVHWNLKDVITVRKRVKDYREQRTSLFNIFQDYIVLFSEETNKTYEFYIYERVSANSVFGRRKDDNSEYEIVNLNIKQKPTPRELDYYKALKELKNVVETDVQRVKVEEPKEVVYDIGSGHVGSTGRIVGYSGIDVGSSGCMVGYSGAPDDSWRDMLRMRMLENENVTGRLFHSKENKSRITMPAVTSREIDLSNRIPLEQEIKKLKKELDDSNYSIKKHYEEMNNLLEEANEIKKKVIEEKQKVKKQHYKDIVKPNINDLKFSYPVDHDRFREFINRVKYQIDKLITEGEQAFLQFEKLDSVLNNYFNNAISRGEPDEVFQHEVYSIVSNFFMEKSMWFNSLLTKREKGLPENEFLATKMEAMEELSQKFSNVS